MLHVIYYNIKMKKRNSPERRPAKKESIKGRDYTICVNRDCKLRRKGCKGSEGCPGYK
jgi:hypothetical protein